MRHREVFLSRKTEGGQFHKIACEAVQKKLYKGIAIVERNAVTDKEINRGQFYQAPAESLSSRMMPESESSLMECVTVLLPGVWPVDLSPECTEEQLEYACHKFLIPFSGQLKQEYRDYKDSKGVDRTGMNVNRLIGAINALPILLLLLLFIIIIISLTSIIIIITKTFTRQCQSVMTNHRRGKKSQLVKSRFK